MKRNSETQNKRALEKYHQNYASVRSIPKRVAVSPVAVQYEARAIELESKGMYRVAAGLWLKCLDSAKTEVERARIAFRRQVCITKGNGLRRGEYSGVCCRGVVYD